MKNRIDILIVARPDHSIQIYKALLTHNKLRFLYLTFKVFPQWVKSLTGFKKLTTVTKNAICSWRLTIIDICRFRLRLRIAREWNETQILNRPLRKIFKKNDIKIIHYWPEYGDVEIQKYVKTHKGVRAYADIHMPHPVVVFESMKPVYRKYGIDSESTDLAVMAREQSDFARNASDILVPSSYVADTYKQIYKGKNFHVVSYGITVSNFYKKRYLGKVFKFVYAGRISLEKGSDLMLEYFSSHPNFLLHLYGGIIPGQESIFEPYQRYSNIIFHGSVPKSELQKHLMNYHVGIHLSRFDAYSLAVGEMIGCGLPVIVSDHTGNMDDIRNNRLGLVTPLDEKEIEETIRKISTPEIYNAIQDSIESYIHDNNRSYPDKMIEFYENQLTF